MAVTAMSIGKVSPFCAAQSFRGAEFLHAFESIETHRRYQAEEQTDRLANCAAAE
jgi:hypothetical protein